MGAEAGAVGSALSRFVRFQGKALFSSLDYRKNNTYSSPYQSFTRSDLERLRKSLMFDVPKSFQNSTTIAFASHLQLGVALLSTVFMISYVLEVMYYSMC
jgi:hypothetical protein